MIKFQRYNLLLFLLSLAVTISACSGGPPEKPPLESLSSPDTLLDQGIRHYNNNNYPKAIHEFEKALLQYRSIDNQPGIANSCLNLAKTHMAFNNNLTAAEYLDKANSVIEQAQLIQLKEHMSLLNSSLAIKNARYDLAIDELKPALTSNNINIKLAALKNRTSIAFLKNDSDKQLWLQRYKTLQNKNPANTSSHAARILRFEAELTDDRNIKSALLSQTLSISQKHANRTAIAATLSQWANLNVKEKKYDKAEDKYLRALFIRHQLGDVKNSMVILEQLNITYISTNNEKAEQASSWISKLSSQDFSDWENLVSDFETYPENRH